MYKPTGNIKCIVCHKKVPRTSTTQKTCIDCRKEYARITNLAKKRKDAIKKKIDKANEKPPTWICPQCEAIIELDFDITKDNTKWSKFRCPLCGGK